jgi:hypothetical protein
MSRGKLVGLILMVIIFSFLANEVQANIVLKTLVVNPSKTKTQTAMLKAYLPKEATAEDVVDLGDLKIDYDIEKGLYFVYQKYELSPGESVSREIEIKDVWVISRAEIDSLLNQARELAEKLKGTAYFDMAVALQKDIESKCSDILERQERAMNALPQTHIGAYRKNVKILDSTNIKLARLEKMVTETKIATGPKAERIHVKATWKLIVAMVVVLGLLSFVFFIIWNRQATIEETKRKIDDGVKS